MDKLMLISFCYFFVVNETLKKEGVCLSGKEIEA
jgi:hypothetical protein